MAGIAAPVLQQTLARLTMAARRIGYSDAQWAIAAGIRPETLSRLRKRQDCDLATLVKMARAAQCVLTLDARMQGDALASDNGLMPSRITLRDERALAALCWREATYERSIDKARTAWTAMAPAFFMSGVALLASQALPPGRTRLRALADALHPGITVAKVFARWRELTPVPAATLLRAILDEAATQQPLAATPTPAVRFAATPSASPPSTQAATPATSARPARPPTKARAADTSEATDAATFMRRFVARLTRQGWSVRTEVPQRFLNDRGREVSGRIDVVAKRDGKVVAYELDRAGAREKSIQKLRAYHPAHEAFVVCRNGRALRVDLARDQQQRAQAVVAGSAPAPRPTRARTAGVPQRSPSSHFRPRGSR